MSQTPSWSQQEERVLAESIEHEMRRMPVVVWADCVVIGCATATMWTALSLPVMLAWCAGANLFAIMRAVLKHLYLKQTDQQRRRWLRGWHLFIPVANILWGSVWGCLFFLAFPHAQLGAQFLLTMLLMGLTRVGAFHKGRGGKWEMRACVWSASICWLVWGQSYQIQMALLAGMLAFVLERVNSQQRSLVKEKAKLVGSMEARVTDLDTRNAQLAAVGRAKTQLLATASHDLRQPIHAILMALDDWTPGLTQAEHGERIQLVRTRIGAMSEMLQGLLDMSRLDLGVFKLNEERTDLGAFLRSHAAGHAVAMTRKGLEFSIETQEVDGLSISTDSGLLGRMLSNLLTNAYKYTWKGSVRLIASRTADGGLSIAVMDTGIGIPQRERQHIFEEYVRLSERHQSTDGVGIGLAVVAKGAALLGYQVDVDSTAGKGSTFSIKLPASSIAADVAESSDHPAPDLPLRILLIEDDVDAAAWTSRVLQRAGHAVRTATDATRALDATGVDFRPDVVVSDFQLASSRNGIEAISALRQHLDAPQLPALLLTGDLTVQVRELARGIDVNILHKPMLPARLLASIREVTPGGMAKPATVLANGQ